TKAFAIAGLRLGYLIAHPQIVNNINRFGIPWGVNVLAQKAGSFILKNYKKLLPDIPSIIQASHTFQKALQEIPELEVLPSNCNFFLIKLKKGNAAELKKYLIKEHGFLIRDASNFRSLSSVHFRVATQTSTFDALLVNATKKWLTNLS
ncbi:MAG: aminotransferase class I/II-fold pyridoxal phosphate-dependent enzyme, partial [Prolixibacteraceae bacterium]|nr:aminotransferase class I/II-fold pyridoxal phosphate-dependent enzyme [Prolixibacteraceae bacterium]